MGPRVHLDILPQPDLVSCGPTCLHSLYRFWGEDISYAQVHDEVERLPHGGTLAVLLACHALERGYRALLYTYDLAMFDPTWFATPPAALATVASTQHAAWAPSAVDLAAKLRAQRRTKRSRAQKTRTADYLRYLDLGGRIAFADMGSALLESWLERGVPILTGLSATYLYRSAREREAPGDPNSLIEDDVRGLPTGHFVVLHGYDRQRGEVHVADPLQPNPVAPNGAYSVDIERLTAAILLGIMTDDANLLVLEPPRGPRSI
jgi:hypothetical protein